MAGVLIYKNTKIRYGCSLNCCFHTQRRGNYSICLLGQKVLAVIFFRTTNKVMRPFSTTTEKQYAK